MASLSTSGICKYLPASWYFKKSLLCCHWFGIWLSEMANYWSCRFKLKLDLFWMMKAGFQRLTVMVCNWGGWRKIQLWMNLVLCWRPCCCASTLFSVLFFFYIETPSPGWNTAILACINSNNALIIKKSGKRKKRARDGKRQVWAKSRKMRKRF
jgi:hypothetical protein